MAANRAGYCFQAMLRCGKSIADGIERVDHATYPGKNGPESRISTFPLVAAAQGA
jgi:hypothetical protein